MNSLSPSRQRVGVVLVAGGSGQRLGYGVPKAQVPLAGKPLLEHALRGIADSGVASVVAVAVPSGDTVLREACSAGDYPFPLIVVDGGAARTDSVRSALDALPRDLDAVLVHDAARALTPPDAFQRVAAALAQGALAVIPAVPVVDTIKSTADSPDGPAPLRVTGTPNRSTLRAVQTPQGFNAVLLRRAHAAALDFPPTQAAAVTDDAMLVESLGTQVYVVPGSELSLKITTPTDLLLAEALVAQGTAAERIQP